MTTAGSDQILTLIFIKLFIKLTYSFRMVGKDFVELWPNEYLTDFFFFLF
jgi:hypothetical protein